MNLSCSRTTVSIHNSCIYQTDVTQAMSNNRPDQNEFQQFTENMKLPSTEEAVPFSPHLHSSFTKLALQMTRSSSNLEVQTVDEQNRIRRGSMCSSTSTDCMSAAILAQQQEAERQRQNGGQRKKVSRTKVNQNSFSSRGSTASHVHSSASSSIVGDGRNMQLVSQCRNCSQDYRSILFSFK